VAGILAVLNYTYVLIRLLSKEAGEFAALTFVCWLVWLVGTVLVFVPQTGRAMPSYRTRFAG
jgi:hypothetical protein